MSRRRAPATRNGTMRPADAFTDAAAVATAGPARCRPRTKASTPAIVMSTTSASLCAPATTWTSTCGFSPTARAGRTGSRPSVSAARHTSATMPSEQSAATTFSVQNAPATLSPDSGYVSSVNAGPYADTAPFEPANGYTASAGTSLGLVV